jgi:hypothetical protein
MALLVQVRARVIVAALFVALAAPTAAMAQGEGETADPPSGSPCEAWGGMRLPLAEGRIPICEAPTITAAELLARNPGLHLPPPLNDETTIFETPDPVGDQFRLDDGSLPGDGDPATDLEGIYHASFGLNGAAARELRDWLGSDATDGARIVNGQPLRRVVRPGDWEWFYFDTAGDPTTTPEEARAYQIAFQGPARRNVPSFVPRTSGLEGAQHIVHYRQDPDGSGDVRHSALWSDAGSNRPGVDGTFYYNSQPRFLVILDDEGLQFLVPKAADRLGAFRPTAWDSRTWDYASTPEGPMAFIPTDGEVPGIFDWIGLGLAHQEVAGQTFTLRGTPRSGVTLPSGFWHPIVSTSLAQLEGPLPIELAYDYQGDDLAFPIEAAFLGDGSVQPMPVHGLVGYGPYCLDGLSIPGVETRTWSDGAPISEVDQAVLTDLGDDWRRVLGTSCIHVDEQQGLNNQAPLDPWLEGSGWWRFDPEVAERMLDEAGWVKTESGWQQGGS